MLDAYSLSQQLQQIQSAMETMKIDHQNALEAMKRDHQNALEAMKRDHQNALEAMKMEARITEDVTRRVKAELKQRLMTAIEVLFA